MNDFLSGLKTKILNSKVLTDSFWSLCGNVIGRGLSLTAGIFVARYLGTEVFGEYGMIKSTILSLATFSSFGLGYTATKFVADFKRSKPHYVKLLLKYSRAITLCTCSIMAVLIFFFADFLASTVLKAPHLKGSIQLLSLLTIINGLNTTQMGILAGFGRFKQIAKITSYVGIITFISSIALTYYFGLEGALIALFISYLFNWFFNWIEVKRNLPSVDKEVKSDVSLFKDILTFSTPVALQEALYAIGMWCINLAFVFFASYSSLGSYNAAMQWYFIILFIPGILRNVILSHLSGADSEEKRDGILKLTIKINLIATAVPAIIIFFLSDVIASFYGESYSDLGDLITVAAFIPVVVGVSNVYSQAYMSKGKNWRMLIIRIVRDYGQLIMFFIIAANFDFDRRYIMLYCLLLMSIVTLLMMIYFYKKE